MADGDVWRRPGFGLTKIGMGIIDRLRNLRSTTQEPVRKSRYKSVTVRHDTDDIVLHAAAEMPSARIAHEIAAGQAFFDRHGFSFQSKSPSDARAAIQELARKIPTLAIDSTKPKASIIIPVYGQLSFVLNCLDSLAAQRSRFTAEIIVIDDASPDEMQTRMLRDIPWIRYIRREQNAGFLDVCNDAADAARGDHFVFLNSDIRVAKDWLDELIGSFDLFPKAGLVGSKLYNDDASLQEAGGIFWREGSAWNYGRDDDGDHPKYCFARRVDYCSGAAIAVPKTAWRAMGGFDPVFRPAYCEDADLAFRLRAAGQEVWLQPLSCAVHYEGRTHGRDLNAGIKSYQVVNMETFAKRWEQTLRHHRPDGVEADAEADRLARKRILVLDAETPMPDRNCGSVIVVGILEALSDLGYQITFLPQENYYFDGHYTTALQRRGIECIYGAFLGNIDMVADLRNDFDYILAFRYYVVRPIFQRLRELFPQARIIFSNVDLHFLREQREAEVHSCRRGRIAALKTKAEELEVFCRADCSIVHTEDEANIIKQYIPLDNILVLPYIAKPVRSDVGFERRHDIMYLGGFSHLPNVDAMLHFTEFVWPLLIERLPSSAKLLIVGSSPPPEMQNLAGDRITVTGFVEDLKPWFDATRVFIAPLRFGAGIKGKVIESLRHGTPSVTTPIGAEGIGLTSGRDALIADLDEDFAQAVVRLYNDPELWQVLQQAGYRLVDQRFSAKQCRDLCVDMLDKADATWILREERALKQRLQSIRDEVS